jgi:hypothetical protein
MTCRGWFSKTKIKFPIYWGSEEENLKILVLPDSNDFKGAIPK